MRLLIARSALVSLAVLALGSYASAHAYVVTSSPAADATVARAPRIVSVAFDEPISLESSEALVVRDARNAFVPCVPEAAVDPQDATRVVCTLARALERGRYSVAWRVTSADTHVVHGTFAFGVGVGVDVGSAKSQPATLTSMYDPGSPLAATLRFLMLYGSLIAAGALVFRREVARQSEVSLDRATRRCTRLVIVAAGIALCAAVPALCVQSIAAHGAAPGRFFGTTLATAANTPWGHAWLLRVLGLVTLCALVSHKEPLALAISSIAGAATLMSFSISGHALDAANPRLVVAGTVADFLHLAGAAIWVGGIVSFICVFARVEKRRAIAAFSPLAVAAVIAIVLSGTYAAIVHLGSPVALFDNTYGLLVVAKIVLLVPLAMLGLRNFSRGAGRRALPGFSGELRAETALLVLIVALSSILTGVAPPRRTIPAMTHMTE